MLPNGRPSGHSPGLLLATLCALALGIVITRMIVTPIRQAVTSASASPGRPDPAIQSSRRDEAGQLLQALGGMQRSLKDTVQQMAGAQPARRGR